MSGTQLPELRWRHALVVWLLCWRSARTLASVYAVLTVLSGLIPATAAWLTKLLVDALATGQPGATVLVLGAGLAGAGLFAGVVPQLSAFLQAELGRRVDLLLQDQLYTAVNGFDGLARFENPAFLDRLRMAAQANGRSLAPVTTGVFGLARDVVVLVSLTATLYLISPVMVLVVLVAAVPTLLAQLSLTRQRVRIRAGLSPAGRKQFFYGSLISDAQAAKEIRLFGLGSFLKERLLGELAVVQRGERQIDRKVLNTQSTLSLIGAVVSGLGLVWAAWQASSGAITIGDVTAFVAALAGAQGAVVGLVSSVTQAHEALLMFGYLEEIRGLEPDLPPVERPVAITPLRRGIELRDVWFRYSDDHPWVLRGVTMRVEHGRSTALVGLNGAGKSTLVKLLCRFYDPVRGSITWDGVDIRDIPVADLRARMGVLFQDFVRYDFTAAENIGLGDLSAMDDRDRVEHAARLAGIAPVLEKLPRGYDTLLSRIFFSESDKDNPDTGIVLSGGQWQRLALARALLRGERDLLVLDEPSSGLDARAEHEIHASLRTHRAGRTSLLISHRLGTIRDADHVVVLDDGSVAEQGTHDQLLIGNGLYAQLFSMQAEGYQPPPTGFRRTEELITRGRTT
ncbi:ABC transporter ATP-binding protein [Lentzea tibetensis]|uniref:ABC transporter ATP-binding protein n=1 Tax=Lentzea tibetensis TaxID=2591470 RepID=A0A563ESW8_9PSEU|nr:ABC transporter ATP-binding protein [Lentzea tibetensis]TWP50702.1 ABC transporter ATP-binding protein [Lentzea tibetensis]